ncbi:unnamed protein product [Sphacelaria rigidula]
MRQLKFFLRIFLETESKLACGTSQPPAYSVWRRSCSIRHSGSEKPQNVKENAFFSTFWRFAKCCGLCGTRYRNPRSHGVVPVCEKRTHQTAVQSSASLPRNLR